MAGMTTDDWLSPQANIFSAMRAGRGTIPAKDADVSPSGLPRHSCKPRSPEVPGMPTVLVTVLGAVMDTVTITCIHEDRRLLI